MALSPVRVILACGLGVAVVASPGVSAQQPPQFRSGVDVVELNVAVYEGRKPVADLGAADLAITDNGVRQEILSIARDTVPIDVTLLIDTSDSVTDEMERAILSAANAITARLRANDRVSLITFDHRIRQLAALQAPAVVSFGGIGRTAGLTSMFDALAVVLSEKPVADRRRMAILFTDGLDSSSFLTERDVLDVAGRSTTAVFTVAKPPEPVVGTVGGSHFSRSFRLEGQSTPFFDRIAAATGGAAQQTVMMRTEAKPGGGFRIVPESGSLDSSFTQALDDFRSSYVVRYTLAGVPRAGRHDVSVTVARRGKNYVVRARTGYIG